MGKNKKNPQKVNINNAVFELAQQEADIEAKQKQGYHPHCAPTLNHFLSSTNITGANHNAQLQAYQEDAAKLPDDNERIKFWLKKAASAHEKSAKRPSSSIQHNFLLNERNYLREAIALGSVDAAIKHNELIQFAISKEHFTLLGDNIPLNDPCCVTLLCMFPLIFVKFHHQDKLTTESGTVLEEAIRTLFSQNKTIQIPVIKALCDGVENRYAPQGIITETVTRNMITSYLINLPAPALNNNSNNNNNKISL